MKIFLGMVLGLSFLSLEVKADACETIRIKLIEKVESVRTFIGHKSPAEITAALMSAHFLLDIYQDTCGKLDKTTASSIAHFL